jgi:hypothetical protein
MEGGGGEEKGRRERERKACQSLGGPAASTLLTEGASERVKEVERERERERERREVGERSLQGAWRPSGTKLAYRRFGKGCQAGG